jgi:GNAT superfamily N-acetyltransferase
VSRKVQVVRTFLELKGPEQLKPARVEDHLLRLARVPVPSVPLVQRLYREVGAQYHWVDRWEWSAKEWREWVEQLGYGLWILTYDGDLAGFFELTNNTEPGRKPDDGSVEVALFGLVAAFQGRGFGKHLLTNAVEIAWAIGAGRVWLHTCTLDDPKALPNYLARGFTKFRKETYEAELD